MTRLPTLLPLCDGLLRNLWSYPHVIQVNLLFNAHVLLCSRFPASKESSDETSEKRQSVPHPDFPPPSLPEGYAADHVDSELRSPSAAQPDVDSISQEAESAASASHLPHNTSTGSLDTATATLNTNSAKSASVWSLENHAGSRENICESRYPDIISCFSFLP